MCLHIHTRYHIHIFVCPHSRCLYVITWNRFDKYARQVSRYFLLFFFSAAFFSICFLKVLIAYLMHVLALIFIVYKMVNAAYILLSQPMPDTLLINIYCSAYICSGCTTCVSEACLMLISSFLLSMYHLGYSRERHVWEASLFQSLCVLRLQHWAICVSLHPCFSVSLTLPSWCKWLLLPPRER